MTVIRDISTIYTSFFSLVLFLILFESRLSQRKTITWTLSLMGPLLIFNSILLFVLGPETMNTLLLLTCSIPSLIFFWFLAKHRDGRFFFTFCFADTIMLEIIYITAILDYFIGNSYYFTVISRLILCPLIAVAFYKWIRPLYQALQNVIHKGWYTFTMISLLFYILMSMSMSTPTHILNRMEQLPTLTLLLLLIPAIYIQIFTALHTQYQLYKTKEHDNILTVQMIGLKHRLDDYTVSSKRFKEERHDFRHKLRTIAALAEKGDLEIVKQTANTYAELMPEHSMENYCDHPILDAVLLTYLEQAKRKNIHVTTKLVFPDTLTFNEAELATALANALENAIQACEHVETSNRYIEVKSIIEPCFMLQVRNSFNGIVSFDEDGIPISVRKGHGFGTRSIATFCNKINAYYTFEAQDKEFTLRIVFS